MNILTFDIEEWVIELNRFGGRQQLYNQFNFFLDELLLILDNHKTRATFFCLGEMARKFPDIVLKISNKGHEIGCHSDKHLWVNKMSRSEFIIDTNLAINSLELLIGKKIKSYRAPAFSINATNTWAFDVLYSYGIENDASVFPISRDFGGYNSFGHYKPVIIKTDKSEILEFPIAPANFWGKKIVFSGGGYFRLMPFFISSFAIKRMDYVMFYFHLSDFMVDNKSFMTKKEYELYFKESGTFLKRLKRYVKSNIRIGNSMNKFSKLMDRYEFCSIEEAINEIKIHNVPNKII